MAKSCLWKLGLLVILVAAIWKWYQSHHRLPPVTEGFFHPAFKPVAELFRKQIEDGTEEGGSFAVYQNGEPLIEVWGGYADPESQRPWKDNTLTIIFSCTKGLSAIAFAKLVERGLVDYKKEIHSYWPEFEQNGKSNITLEMFLAHQAGLVTMGGKEITLMEYKNDWPKVEKLMAEAKPDFPPGTASAYHALTFAMYLDALIRKIDPKHRNLTQFFAEEIARPYGLDLFIGLPKEEYYRYTRIRPVPPWALITWLFDSVHRPLLWAVLQSDSLVRKSTVVPDVLQAVNNPDLLEVGLGSVMGFGSARSLAKLYDFIANGGSIGTNNLLPQNIVNEFSQVFGPDVPSPTPMKIKFSRGLFVSKNSADTTVIGHPGYGGQQASADPKHKFGIAYVTNILNPKYAAPPDHYVELEKLFYDCYWKYQADSNRKKK